VLARQMPDQETGTLSRCEDPGAKKEIGEYRRQQ